MSATGGEGFVYHLQGVGRAERGRRRIHNPIRGRNREKFRGKGNWNRSPVTNIEAVKVESGYERALLCFGEEEEGGEAGAGSDYRYIWRR